MPEQDDEDIILDSFMRYVKEQGIQVSPSIRPYRFPGRGLGIHATNWIEPNTPLIHVPRSALLIPSAIPQTFCSDTARESLSVHALLAAYIAFDNSFNSEDGKHAAWRATWPSLEECRASVPLLWPARLRGKFTILGDGSIVSYEEEEGSRQHDEQGTLNLLPASITTMLEAQNAKYRHDFETAVSLIPRAKAAFEQSPQFAGESFKYGWCMVNTRCLYFKSGSSAGSQNKTSSPLKKTTTKSKRNHDNNPCMALCPFIDLFNHTASSSNNDNHPPSVAICTVTSSPTTGFTVTAPKTPFPNPSPDIDPVLSTELLVSYGPHSNDFLLVEYGFLLPSNTNSNIHDSTSLDSVILPTLTDEQKKRLEGRGYLGSYTLFPPFPLPQAEASKGKATGEGRAASVCWRTEVAARIGLVPIEQWEGLVDGTLEDDEDVGERVQEKVRFWVKAMHEEARRSVEVLEKMGGEPRGILRIFGDGDDDKSTGATRQSEPGRNLNVEIEPGYSSANPDANADTILKREIEAPLPISASVAQRRYDLVLTRYRQILETCDSYLCI